jgi:hypothetical protein
MSARRILGLFGLLGFVTVSVAAAQGLGDLAAREKTRRTQSKKPEARVFTNDDLDAGRPPGQKKEEGAAAAQPAAAGAPEVLQPVRDESRGQDDRPYVEALRAAEAEVAAAEARVRELSGKLNPMSTTFIFGAGGSNDANEELRVRNELRQAEEQLSAARQAVVSASRNLQDFRAGRPIGSDEPR